jgi:hypothetical protein
VTGEHGPVVGSVVHIIDISPRAENVIHISDNVISL